MLIFIFIVGVAACSSSRNDISDDAEGYSQSRPILAKRLAPETAQVEAALDEYKENETYYSCIIKLEKVLAYGPATPPLAEGSKLSVEMAKDLIKNKFKSIEAMLASKRLFTMTLRKNKGGMGIDVRETHRWSVIKIE